MWKIITALYMICGIAVGALGVAGILGGAYGAITENFLEGVGMMTVSAFPAAVGFAAIMNALARTTISP